MLTLRNKIKNLDANVMLKMHEWVWKKKGSTEMIKSYLKAINTIMKSLTAKEIQEAEALAKEWNEWQPPQDVQSETTEKKGHKYAEEFAKEMWKWCGARVVVMVAWEDADGEILTNSSRHDFNDELGNGKLFEELDECQDKFVKYVQTTFVNGGTNAESPDATPWSRQRKSNGKPKTILPVSKNSTPYIPNILDMQAPKLKDIMRTFVTFHYWKACRNSQATVTWSVITTNTALYIAPQFLPPEVPFKELSRLTQDELTVILEWWQERKEWHPNNIFSFKKWRDAGGSGARMCAKQDLDGRPEHLAGKRMMDKMMWGRRKLQWQTALPSNRNDSTGTHMVDEDAAEAVPLLDSQQWIARCQVAEGNTCQPIAIGKEPSNALQQVEGGITSPVQPVPDACCIDFPDSVYPGRSFGSANNYQERP
ncbi:hypothetical protein F5J12DRAFT_783028 [Pisolithus orientalis]|uniref:uncharacterized protein n=1 Tax=Pisolithus orientalis TaxID=936130 RepID=UPI0022243D91|nr:uncharacterized protein F5J12DRAFT_783028 [Pisolithus orientalis]KAI6006255.1 hypothetical protein F5J12DRAFT_783028 [Pisolithus orientalis]